MWLSHLQGGLVIAQVPQLIPGRSLDCSDSVIKFITQAVTLSELTNLFLHSTAWEYVLKQFIEHFILCVFCKKQSSGILPQGKFVLKAHPLWGDYFHIIFIKSLKLTNLLFWKLFHFSNFLNHVSYEDKPLYSRTAWTKALKAVKTKHFPLHLGFTFLDHFNTVWVKISFSLMYEHDHRRLKSCNLNFFVVMFSLMS